MPRRPMTLGVQINSASISPALGFESTGETYIEGACLILDTVDSNRLSEGGANPTDIQGIAAKTASGTAGLPMPYYPALPGVAFEGSMDDSNDLGNGVLLASDFGKLYGVTKDSSGIWYVDKFKTSTDARVKIIGFRDPAATVQGRLFFVFLIG